MEFCEDGYCDIDNGVKYKQCVLVKEKDKARTTQTSWVPEHLARAGKLLQIKEGNVWTDGWRVESVSETCQTESQIPKELWKMNESIFWRPYYHARWFI